MVSNATIKFLGDWCQEQHGAIERGGRLKIDFNKERLPFCFTNWRGAEFGDIIVYLRFHPRGEIVNSSVLAPVRNSENPPGMVIGHRPVPFELPVPDDATQVEIWFHNFYQTSSHCDSWDSRFSENYWFDIGGEPPRIPSPPVSYRNGAVTRPDIVNVLDQSAMKALPALAESGSPPNTGPQTMLKVAAWVKETTYGANAWIDVHIFDGQDKLIRAETFTLSYTGFGSSFQYDFYGNVYQDTTATSGPMQPQHEACKIQYRLYYEINYQLFTDGILHQLELKDEGAER